MWRGDDELDYQQKKENTLKVFKQKNVSLKSRKNTKKIYSIIHTYVITLKHFLKSEIVT